MEELDLLRESILFKCSDTRQQVNFTEAVVLRNQIIFGIDLTRDYERIRYEWLQLEWWRIRRAWLWNFYCE